MKSPEIYWELGKIDTNHLNELLGDNDEVSTEKLSLTLDLEHIVLRRMIDYDIEQLLERSDEAILAIETFSNHTEIMEAMFHLEDIGICPNGLPFSGYGLFQVIIDQKGPKQSLGISIKTDGTIIRLNSTNKDHTPEQISKLIKHMLQELKMRDDDQRQTIRAIMNIAIATEAKGKIRSQQPTHHREENKSDTVALPRLTRTEALARIEKVRQALLKKAHSLPASIS